MMTMPAMMLAEVTLLFGSYLRAVGMSSWMLMNVCMNNSHLSCTTHMRRAAAILTFTAPVGTLTCDR